MTELFNDPAALRAHLEDEANRVVLNMTPAAMASLTSPYLRAAAMLASDMVATCRTGRRAEFARVAYSVDVAGSGELGKHAYAAYQLACVANTETKVKACAKTRLQGIAGLNGVGRPLMAEIAIELWQAHAGSDRDGQQAA